MGVPDRFAIEYPQRALQLIDMLEGPARDSDLLGSLGLLVASAVLTIPFERMKPSHFLHEDDRDADLVKSLKELSRVRFLEAPFWQRAPEANAWRQSRVMNSVRLRYYGDSAF